MAGSSTLATACPNVRASARAVAAADAVRLVDGDAGLACDLSADEARLLDLLDGSRDIATLAREAIALAPPLRPAATLGVLRRLYECGLLEGLSTVAAMELGAQPEATGAAITRWLRVRLRVGLPAALGRILAPVPLSASATRGLAALGLGLSALLLVALVALGLDQRALDPFAGRPLALRALELYAGAALVLSLRGLLRGAALRGVGEAPRPMLSFNGGVLHLDVDDRARRWLDAPARSGLYFAGIAGLALPAALALGDRLAAFVWPHALPPLLSAALATAPYLLLLDLAPYGRGDGWQLAGVLTRVPDLRRRSAAFLLRRTAHNLLQAQPPSAAERTYLLLASAWLGHALLAAWMLTSHLLPALLRAVTSLARGGDGSPLTWGLGLVAAAGLLAVVVAIAVALVVILASALLQLTARRGAARAIGAPIGEASEDILDAMAAVPFLAQLPREELAPIVAGMRREAYRDGELIVRQGDVGDRFCLISRGDADVVVEETSGLRHRVASLRAGDFFGEIALLEERPRTATVRARGETTVLSLDRPSFVTLVEHSSFAREAVLEQVRNAAFLRSVEAFAHLAPAALGTLLARLRQCTVAPGDAIVRQGDPGDCLYVIRSGEVRVEREEDGVVRTLDRLGRGEVFGEFALLSGVARTATVIAAEACELIEVPGDCLDELLLGELRVAVAFEAAMARRRLAHGAAQP